MKKVLLGVFIGVLVSIPANTLAASVFDQTIHVGRGSFGYVQRWDDPDFKVKCWEFEDNNAGGVSCLPWSEVKER